MTRLITIILVTLFFSVSHAQEISTAYSAPGSIGKKTYVTAFKAFRRMGTSIICTASLQDPSGDAILSEGEHIEMTISVKNFHPQQTIYPKLEILMLPSQSLRPMFKIIWLKEIKPGETAIHNEIFQWRQGLPPCTVTYKFRAFDSVAGMSSFYAEVFFNIQN